jgi:hypothetical protein
MPYATSMEMLLATLRSRCPEECDWLKHERSSAQHGLLSVGLKLHLISISPGFSTLVDELGGTLFFERNVYRRSAAKLCFVLPPVGSAQAAIRLLECIGKYTETKIFDNPDVQIQVCSPGRLDRKRAAYLAIAFYLNSDTLRRYKLDQFITTVSYDDSYKRGRRMVIYDADYRGAFERDFEWWSSAPHGARIVKPLLPFASAARTDVLIGPGSAMDIENINLVATLLVHAQFVEHLGYWRALGENFETMFASLLEEHCLTGIVEAPWVHPGEFMDLEGDRAFFAALQELMSYAYDEARRLVPYRSLPFGAIMNPPPEGILSSAVGLVDMFRTTLTARSEAAAYGDPS